MKKTYFVISTSGTGERAFADMLCSHYLLKVVSVRDLFREALFFDGPLSQEIRSYMDNGVLVPDDVVTRLIDRVIAEETSDILFLYYPRTGKQAELLVDLLEQHNYKLDRIWYLKLKNLQSLIDYKAEMLGNDWTEKYESIVDSIKEKGIIRNAQCEDIKVSMGRYNIHVIEHGYPIEKEMGRLREYIL